jgi:hypothetical protein
VAGPSRGLLGHGIDRHRDHPALRPGPDRERSALPRAGTSHRVDSPLHPGGCRVPRLPQRRSAPWPWRSDSPW